MIDEELLRTKYLTSSSHHSIGKARQALENQRWLGFAGFPPL